MWGWGSSAPQGGQDEQAEQIEELSFLLEGLVLTAGAALGTGATLIWQHYQRGSATTCSIEGPKHPDRPTSGLPPTPVVHYAKFEAQEEFIRVEKELVDIKHLGLSLARKNAVRDHNGKLLLLLKTIHILNEFIAYISADNRLDEEGLFRTGGTKTIYEAMYASLMNTDDGLKSFASYAGDFLAPDACSLIKHALKTNFVDVNGMNLFSNEFMDLFCMAHDSDEAQAHAFKDLLKEALQSKDKIKLYQAVVIHQMLHIMHLVYKSREQNKMNGVNLATCFFPVISQMCNLPDKIPTTDDRERLGKLIENDIFSKPMSHDDTWEAYTGEKPTDKARRRKLK